MSFIAVRPAGVPKINNNSKIEIKTYINKHEVKDNNDTNILGEWELGKIDVLDIFNTDATLGPVNEINMARIWNKHKQPNAPLKVKVFVALSGGVDSATAALLLKESGYQASGAFMDL